LSAVRSLLITGASGFVGRHVLRRLDPSRFDRITLLTRTELALPGPLDSATDVEQIRSGLDRPERYAGRIDSATAILHLAARTGRAKPEQYERDNVEGTGALVRAAEEQEAAGIVNVSSIAAAFPETIHYPYASSKRAAEDLVSRSMVPWTTIRPTMVLGAGSPIWTKLRQLARPPVIVVPGAPTTRVQPIHVDDLASVLVEVAAKGAFDREVHELGGGEVVTIEDLLRRIHRRLGGRRAAVVPTPVGPGIPLLRAFERISPVPLPVTEGQLSTFLYDGVARRDGLQARYADRLRGVDDILATLD